MYIKKISLKNFRNYSLQDIYLEKGINVFYGKNAQGKTNILESIFICSIGKSFRTNREKELIKINENFSKIKIDYEKKDREGNISLDINEKKVFYINGIKVKKISEILGKINVVLFCPADINILKGNPAGRRKFLDIMISQLRPNYLYTLNQYIKTMEQRNNYLRQIKYENKDEKMLEIWDEELAKVGEIIYKYRNEFIEKIKNKINNIHKNITQAQEKIKIEYKSNCFNKEKFLENLKKQRKIDIQRGYTGIGIHRDDFFVYINEILVNVYGSQGQNRTVILSLKLAELEISYEEMGEYPILLLDDFMSELDTERRKSFLNNIKEMQVLITCTEKIEENIEEIKTFNVENACITERI